MDLIKNILSILDVSVSKNRLGNYDSLRSVRTQIRFVPPRNDGRINNRKELIHFKNAAFTLAETLITIGIIGVVAAMTIPNLIQENQKRATVTKLQKGISVINQAYKLSFDEQGDPESAFDIGSEEYFKQYWQPYLKVVTYCDFYTTCGYKSNVPFHLANNTNGSMRVIADDLRTTFYTADGLLYMILTGRSSEGNIISDNRIYLDINGGEAPNKYGRDVFMLERMEDGGGVRAYGYGFTDSEINESCNKTGDGYYCAEKIRRAGWKIKKDYPW
ncbi:type II secretion system protein [bacterium]|nr:type II secretion system protein [bacterium]